VVKVFRSAVIDAPIDRVWQLLRDFNGHDRWHPAVAFSEIENGEPSDRVGCVRRFRLRAGGVLRERLLKLSDLERAFTYCILESPIPLNGYVASVVLKEVTDGARTLWVWSSEFEAPEDREAELAALVGQSIYEAGFGAVRSLLAPAPDGAVAAATREPARAVRRDGPVESHRAGAIVVRRHGGPDVLEWGEAEAPAPGSGEVRLRHTAIGVNYIDVYCRTGYIPLLTPPGTPGMEAAGVVLDVGEGVYGIYRGTRVAYACAPVGAYATERTMKADLLVALPDDIDDETAAGGLLKGMTAAFLLDRVRPLRRGEAVLIHAAAGGVGLLLCQWARHLGATTIGTVSTEEKAKLAASHGCAYPIVVGVRDIAAAVLDITGGRGVEVVYDGIGRDSFAQSFAALAVRGHLISYGQASGDIGPVEVSGFAAKSATLSRPNFGHYAGDPADVRAMADRLFDVIRRGVVKVPVRQRYPLREAGRAHRDLEARRTAGSTILLP
jgi:NADPH:quinone reductase